MDDRIQRLIDESDIRRIIARYCRGTDRKELDLVRSSFHDDAVIEQGDFIGGVDAFMDFCSNGRTPFAVTTHFTGNQLIEFDGPAAWVETYVQAWHRLAGQNGEPDKDMRAQARYIDRFEKRAGEWRIVHHTAIVDCGRVDAVTDIWPRVPPASGREPPTPGSASSG